MFGLSGRQIFILLFVVALFYAGAQYIPPYIAAYQFNDFIRQEVKYAVSTRKTEYVMRADIVQEAKQLGIPITARDIKITRRGPSFTLDVEYRWPIDLKVYKHELVFHPSENGEIFENAPN